MSKELLEQAEQLRSQTQAHVQRGKKEQDLVLLNGGAASGTSSTSKRQKTDKAGSANSVIRLFKNQGIPVNQLSG